MLIPKDLFKSLICSGCNKYLSVLPIKVYFNREVKCGRCCKDNDGGTVSTLYQTVIENVPFPCIYRKEGCRELYLVSEMKSHEEECFTLFKDYQCPICYKPDEYWADSYYLSLHVERKHADIMLKDTDFLCIDVIGDEIQKDFFYHNEDNLLYISVSYDGKIIRFEPCATHFDKTVIQFFLYSVENKLLKQTDRVECPGWNNSLDPVHINLDITAIKFPKNVVICKFQVFRECASVLSSAEPPIYDGSISRAVLRYTFKGFSKGFGDLKENQKFYSDVSYYLMNLPWKLFIKKIYFHSYYLGAYLELDSEKGASCNVKFELRLLSNSNNKVSKKFQHIMFRPGKNKGIPYFVALKTLFNKESGYVVNDSITIEVDLSINE